MTIATPVLALLAGLLGLMVGSFLNVVVHRVPIGQSVVRPRSHCPSCGAGVRPRDEVPVLSWLLLQGRCRDCSTPISPRYPLVELGTGLVFAALAVRLGPDDLAALPAYLYLGAVGLALALIDLDTKRLPDVLTLPSYPVGIGLLCLAAALDDDWSALRRGLVGLVALYAVYFVLRHGTGRRGMGAGDVKLAGVLGLYTAYLGWGSWVVGLFAGFVLGGVFSIALVVLGRAGRKTRVPFGPFMLAGALLAVLAGQPLARGYLDLTLGG